MLSASAAAPKHRASQTRINCNLNTAGVAFVSRHGVGDRSISPSAILEPWSPAVPEHETTY